MQSTSSFLGSYLQALAPFLARPGVTDIYINSPGEVWIEASGCAPECIAVPELTATTLSRFARQVAAINSQGISRENPLLSGSLPDGSRIQAVLPPATRGDIAVAIRRHATGGLTLQGFHEAGAFLNLGRPSDETAAFHKALGTPSDPVDLMRQAVRSRKNILISGGTSSGKTTFLNALLQEVPANERLILIEDTSELQVQHRNSVGLLAARGMTGEANVTAEDLLIASLRMRPDRIVLGEIRGVEALTFLRAINTGHPGSMSTIHADTPDRAIDQLALLILQAGANLRWDEVIRYITKSIDFIVQMRNINGVREVVSIKYL